jgi:hypothetical protein
VDKAHPADETHSRSNDDAPVTPGATKEETVRIKTKNKEKNKESSYVKEILKKVTLPSKY